MTSKSTAVDLDVTFDGGKAKPATGTIYPISLCEAPRPCARGTNANGISDTKCVGAESDREAELRCEPTTAMRLLFGPLAPSQVLPLPSKAAVLDAWCPLPLTWTNQDGI